MSSSSTLTLRNVPFLHWDEWIQVKNGIYSKNHDIQMEALRRISIWRSRGNLPHSVDLTGQIVEVQNQDPIYCIEASTKHTFPDKNSQADNLRLLYSVIVVRSVNGIVEPSQQSFFAQSILSIAERLGLPGWIVELRHDATHKQLPSLSVLRAAGDYLLNWYFQNYWEPQMNLLQSLTQSCIPIKLLITDKEQCTPELQHQWIQSLMKNMNSSTFTTDLFFPFFISAVIKISLSSWYYSIDKDIQYCFQKLLNQQYTTWMPIFQRILEFKDNWLDAYYCRLIHVFIELLNDFPKLTPSSNGEERFIENHYQLKLVLAWFMNLRKLEIASSSTSSSGTISLNIPNQKLLKPKKKKRRALHKNASNTSLSSLTSLTGASSVSTLVLLRWKRREFLRSMKYQLDYTISFVQKNQIDLYNLVTKEIELFSKLVEHSLNDANPLDESAEDEKNQERDIERKKFLQEVSDYLLPPKKQKTKDQSEGAMESDKDEGNDQDEEAKESLSKKRSLEEAAGDENDQDEEEEENDANEGEGPESPIPSRQLHHLKSSSVSSVPVNYPPENLFQNYLDNGNPEHRIYQCHDFPLWSLGLMPGKFDCSELFTIREIS